MRAGIYDAVPCHKSSRQSAELEPEIDDWPRPGTRPAQQ